MNKDLEQIRIYISKEDIKFIKLKNKSISKYISELILKDKSK